MVLQGTYAEGREVLSFNHGWRFARFGGLPDGSVRQEPGGLEKPAADDTDWQLLNLPHDWGIEGPFRAELKADGRDLSFVTVSLADAGGVQVPNANNRVHFELAGPGSIVAVGNGDATCLDSFQSSNVRLFNGLALVVVKTKEGAGGDLVLRARSESMASAEIRLQSN